MQTIQMIKVLKFTPEEKGRGLWKVHALKILREYFYKYKIMVYGYNLKKNFKGLMCSELQLFSIKI
jgi:hypothetical protein